MPEPERYLLLALSLLVARQRAKAQGEHERFFFTALRRPVLFPFVHERGGWRCALNGRDQEVFSASVLVAESVDFVSPVSALGPHTRVVQTRPGVIAEIKLSGQFESWLGLSPDDAVYAVYSPLHVLFTERTGFFLPRQESWHSYLARCIAVRMPQGRYIAGGDATRVIWNEGEIEVAERATAAFFAYRSTTLHFELEVGEDGFQLAASADQTSGLSGALKNFCAAQTMPIGIRASMEGASQIRILGGGNEC